MEDWENIHEMAAKHAEATVYTLNNEYLDSFAKQEVEMWYQFPSHITTYLLLCMAILSTSYEISWVYILGIPLVINAIVGIVNWNLFNNGFRLRLYRTIFRPLIMWLIVLSAAAYLLYHSLYVYATLLVVANLGVISIIEPHMWIYSQLSLKYHMHPKYSYIKRKYGYRFPFEA